MRNSEAGKKAREKLEASTAKTEEEIKREEEIRAKYGTTPLESSPPKDTPKSVWKRKFRPLPEAKAVELFSDVVGDAFILAVAGGLITYEYWKSSQKPDKNLELIEALRNQVDELARRETELEEEEKRQRERVAMLEEALRALQDPKTKKPLLSLPTA